MKQTWVRLSAFIIGAALLAPVASFAQQEEKEKTKEKETKEVENIIITRNGDKNEKMTVVIDGDKVTINGKPLEDYKGKDGSINVVRSKYKTDGLFNLAKGYKAGTTFNDFGGNYQVFNESSNRAMLGVTTEKVEGGVKINDITKESAAEKIGLKEGDVITKINETRIESSDALSKAIRAYKPGDKVTVTYNRDNKEQKATAELTKWKSSTWTVEGDAFKELLTENFKSIPRTPHYPENYGIARAGRSTPKLGLSVQDTDDGKGVKVIEIDNDSNAEKAGIKENDVISEVDGKAVNSTDEVVKILRDSKDKPSVMVKLQRDGKTQNIELKIPRKIKTADL